MLEFYKYLYTIHGYLTNKKCNKTTFDFLYEYSRKYDILDYFELVIVENNLSAYKVKIHSLIKKRQTQNKLEFLLSIFNKLLSNNHKFYIRGNFCLSYFIFNDYTSLNCNIIDLYINRKDIKFFVKKFIKFGFKLEKNIVDFESSYIILQNNTNGIVIKLIYIFLSNPAISFYDFNGCCYNEYSNKIFFNKYEQFFFLIDSFISAFKLNNSQLICESIQKCIFNILYFLKKNYLDINIINKMITNKNLKEMHNNFENIFLRIFKIEYQTLFERKISIIEFLLDEDIINTLTNQQRFPDLFFLKNKCYACNVLKYDEINNENLYKLYFQKIHRGRLLKYKSFVEYNLFKNNDIFLYIRFPLDIKELIIEYFFINVDGIKFNNNITIYDNEIYEYHFSIGVNYIFRFKTKFYNTIVIRYDYDIFYSFFKLKLIINLLIRLFDNENYPIVSEVNNCIKLYNFD